MTLKPLRVLRYSLFSGMFLLHGHCDAQSPDTSQLPINYNYNHIENDTALVHLKAFYRASKDSVPRSFRILHLGDSHVKSGYFAESFAALMDSLLRESSGRIILQDSDSVFVRLKVVAKNGAMAKTLLQSVYSDTAVSNFDPDLVIISLGTNEAYNNLNADTLAFYQERLIRNIVRDAPHADILITTPGDGLKKYYTRVRVSKKKRRYRKVAHFKTNEYLPEVVEYYRNLSRKYNVAVWNFYPVMGGEEAIKQWCRLGYAQRDMIHLTKQGYYLESQLLFESVLESLER